VYNLLEELEYFVVNNNYFSGSINAKISSNLPKLDSYTVNNNYFTGPNILLHNISAGLNYVQLNSNYFSSSLPSNWTRFQNLQYVYMDNNLIEGSVPNTIGTSLDYGNISGNAIGTYEIVSHSRVSFVQFSAAGNFLTGSLPSELGSHTALTLLSFGSNYLVGSLPSSLVKLVALQTFNISNNKFTGSLAPLYANYSSGNATNSSVSVSFGMKMQYFDASNNSFAGAIPELLFAAASTSLRMVALETNCFSGALPSTICDAVNLEVLVLNAVSIAPSCQFSFPQGQDGLRKIVKGVVLASSSIVEGTLPTCVWSMSQLETLHMAGNALHGTIPDLEVYGPALTSVQLGINQLTGTIPLSLQHRGNFTFLGLQHNKLTGTLSSSFTVNQNTNNVTLKLHVNRLSGHIPDTIYNYQTSDVLTGNIFQCDANGQDLPINDPSRDTYVCGSDGFNVSIYVWATVVGILVLAAVMVIALVYYITNYSSLSLLTSPQTSIDDASGGTLRSVSKAVEAKQSILRFYLNTLFWYRYKPSAKQDSTYSNTFQFLAIMKRASRGMLRIGSVYIVVCMTVYVCLKTVQTHQSDSISTVYYQYAWVITAAYMHGVAPCVVVLVFLWFSLLVICATVRSKRAKKARTTIGSKISVIRQFSRNMSSLQRLSILQEAAGSWSQSAFCMPSSMATVQKSLLTVFVYLIVPFVCQMVNLVVTITVNSEYVSIINSGLLTPTQLFMLQLCLSAIKLIWAATFIPWTISSVMNTSKYSLSAGLSLCHHVFMLCAQQIVAPILASSYYSENCFYNVFVPNQSLSSTYTHSVSTISCNEIFDVDVLADGVSLAYVNYVCSYSDEEETVNTVTSPPFVYSFQCGSTFLANYIPVLMYSYVFAALFLPVMRFILLHWAEEIETCCPTFIFDILVSTTLVRSVRQNHAVADKNNDGSTLTTQTTPFTTMVESKSSTVSASAETVDTRSVLNRHRVSPFFNGSNVVAKRLLDFAIMVTFGLACPVLGLAVSVSVFTNAGVWRLAVGKYLSQENTEALSRHRSLFDKERRVLEFLRLELSTKGLLTGSVSAMWVVTVVASLFWSLMCYDMIADVYGLHAGLTVVLVVITCIPSSLYLCLKVFDSNDVYGRLLGKFQLRTLLEGATDENINRRDLSAFGFSTVFPPEFNSIFERNTNSQTEMELAAVN
jgi:hypothetical protein